MGQLWSVCESSFTRHDLPIVTKHQSNLRMKLVCGGNLCLEEEEEEEEGEGGEEDRFPDFLVPFTF